MLALQNLPARWERGRYRWMVNALAPRGGGGNDDYHLFENTYSYKSEIKSKTVGLHQNTGVTAS